MDTPPTPPTPPDPDAEGTEKPDDGCPAHVKKLAEGCVYFVEEALQLRLDYTQDTLPILDHYLREASQDEKVASGAMPEVGALLAPAAGAYFGELVRRSLPDARWHAPGEDFANYRIEFGSFFLHFNPVGVAQEVITGEDAPGWNGHFAMLEAGRKVVEPTLAQGLAMRDADYYSLSVRYETLEQVASVLEAFAKQDAGPRPTYDAAVYAAAAGKAGDTQAR